MRTKEEIAAYQKSYREKNKERLKEQDRLKYIRNREFKLQQVKDYYISNKVTKLIYAREYVRKKRKTDPLFKLIGNLRHRIKQAFKSKRQHKSNTTINILGASIVEVKKHLEIQFQSGMTWENHGKWHIDHIIPLSSAGSEQELVKLCHYSNLQPLWAADNIRKSDKR